MRAFFVAERPPTDGPAERLREAGIELEAIDGPTTLAEALVALEPHLGAGSAAAVVLGDDSDLSLAAALVAVKLPLPLVAIPEAVDARSRNGRLLAQLTEGTLGDDPSEIAAWARSGGAGTPGAPAE